MVESVENFRFSVNSRTCCQTKRSEMPLILESQNGCHLDVFLPKQHIFQDSCIDHLRCLGKSLFPFYLISFSKLNDFTIDYFTKEVSLMTFSSPELTFLEISRKDLILEAYNGQMFFLLKQENFQDSCINHIRHLGKYLSPHILTRSLYLN